jgi:hypothetical protein
MSTSRIALLLPSLAAAACALDVPPAEPTFDQGQGRPTVTLYQLQDVDAEGHPDVDTEVRVTNLVVTAVDRYDEDGQGRTGTLFVQEMDGGPFSGIQMFRPTIQPASEYLLPGDVVEVAGTYVEFELGQINPDNADPAGRTVTQITDGIARKTGEWRAPEPTLVEAPEDLQVDPAAEQWEGVLVEIEDVEASTAPDSRGAFFAQGARACVTTRDQETCVQIDDDNYGIPGVAAGTRLSRVAGVVTYLYTYKVLPRSALDAEVDAPAQN